MKEISLNILDIAQNSVKAGASLIEIKLDEDDKTLSFEITDDGCGMTADFLAKVTDPFTTTRKTRGVGLGLPLLKMEAEMTGGTFSISSKSEKEHPADHGTRIEATFIKDHIDYIPLGDVVSTMTTLIQGHPESDFLFHHVFPGGEAFLDTREIRKELGPDVPLSEFEVITWIGEYLKEQYTSN